MPLSLFLKNAFLEALLDLKLDSFWLDFKKLFLKQNGNNRLYRHWLEPITPFKIEKKGGYLQLTLQAPSDLHKKWLQENFLEIFHKYFQNAYKQTCRIQLEVAPRLPFKKNTIPVKAYSLQKHNIFFNPDYIFENFVVGKNNHLAYGASLAVSKNKTANKNFNPLFIYGPSGLGKTHLLNAIGQKNLKKYPENKILYLSTERFLNEYITALQNRQMDQFRKKFRKNCNLLLMDDIQILSKGKGVQEEFFHTFNELYNQKTQIIVCCDQNPGAIPHLEERIKSRLEGGLMVDISYPDEETRLAILKNKTEQRNLFLSSQSLERIVQTCKGSIREMEGVLNNIKIMTELHEGQISLKEVEKILKKIKKELTVEEVKKKVSRSFSIPEEKLMSPSRKKHIVIARQTAMYLIRKNLKKSLNDISTAFGKKDHTTVLNSIKKVEKLKSEDKEFKRLLELLQREIHNDY